ncbi:phosphogluconate dehydrogenase C-terminal domain-containing protein [Pseudogracilibacillus sp. SO30301A]|uniref:phosphogluconate dehydrogenase C-terminal domain-containing protein n=1 Tax=Pseudogracilibacillus sp. SO30301A TaxID=3098291 RepID=UPI00300E55D9
MIKRVNSHLDVSFIFEKDTDSWNVEVVTCMIGTLLKESLDEVVKKGIPEEAAKAMFSLRHQIYVSNLA